MKAHPDMNDTHRSEGAEGVRGRSDRAHKFNGKDHRRFPLERFDDIKLATAPDYLVKGITGATK